MNAPWQHLLLGTDELLDWLPNETVYSLASRYHRLSGAIRPDVTARRLFGHARGGYPHDLPGGLGHFASAFGDRLGSATRVAMEHTILPLLIAFLGSEQRADVVTATSADSICGLKSRLGLPASGFGALYPLKACPMCMTHDRTAHDVAYWHLDQQLPGVWICPIHNCILHVSSSKRAGQNRFGWSLPTESDLVAAVSTSSGNTNAVVSSPVLKLFAQASIAAAASSRASDDGPEELSKTLLSRLIELGHATPDGRLHIKSLVAAFRNAMEPTSAIPELAAICSSDGAAQAHVYRVLNESGHSGHPLRYLSMIVWLFGTWEAFLERRAHFHEPQADIQHRPATTSPRPNAAKRKQVLQWIHSGDISISQAARRADVDVATAQAWASAVGIQPPKRPSKLRTKTNSMLIENLRSGMEKEQAARLAGVSVSTVSKSLRTNVDLHRAWQVARREHARFQARAEWAEALNSCQHLGPSAARQLATASYAWLYRNDRGWLLSAVGSTSKAHRGNNRRIDWQSRDKRLSMRVEAVVQQLLSMRDPRQRITLVDIFRCVPELKPKLCRDEMLPLTIRAVQRAVGGSRRRASNLI